MRHGQCSGDLMVNAMRHSRPPRGPCRPLLHCLVVVGWLVAPTTVSGLGSPPGSGAAFERCRTIEEQAARLRCYEAATAKSGSGNTQQGPLVGTWRLVRTPNPAGRDAVAIMQTADISRSDLDLAGLMLRCGDGATEVLFVVVQPFRPRAHPKITVATGAKGIVFTGSVVPPGLMVLLPAEAAALAAGPWQSAKELRVLIEDAQDSVRGVIPLSGLGPALQLLQSNCPRQ